MRIVDQCQDLYGGLSRSNKEMIIALLKQPTDPFWQQAQRIIVSPLPLLSIGMAVQRVSKNIVLHTPDPFTIYRALQYAINSRKNFLTQEHFREFES